MTEVGGRSCPPGSRQELGVSGEAKGGHWARPGKCGAEAGETGRARSGPREPQEGFWPLSMRALEAAEGF